MDLLIYSIIEMPIEISERFVNVYSWDTFMVYCQLSEILGRQG